MLPTIFKAVLSKLRTEVDENNVHGETEWLPGGTEGMNQLVAWTYPTDWNLYWPRPKILRLVSFTL